MSGATSVIAPLHLHLCNPRNKKNPIELLQFEPGSRLSFAETVDHSQPIVALGKMVNNDTAHQYHLKRVLLKMHKVLSMCKNNSQTAWCRDVLWYTSVLRCRPNSNKSSQTTPDQRLHPEACLYFQLRQEMCSFDRPISPDSPEPPVSLKNGLLSHSLSFLQTPTGNHITVPIGTLQQPTWHQSPT